jgi:hypothetical protein
MERDLFELYINSIIFIELIDLFEGELLYNFFIFQIIL